MSDDTILLQCPECGGTTIRVDPITHTCSGTVFPGGIDDDGGGNWDWDEDAIAICVDCDHDGEAKDFEPKQGDDSNAS